jgi:membrane associated rhomboid family serine protease
MKISFRFIAKIGLLLVVVGFFMPIACNNNGFELAQSMNKLDKTVSMIFLYVVFCAAVLGCIIGLLLIVRRKIKAHYDWICVLASIGGGLVVYFSELDRIRVKDLQTGAFVILAGWIIALLAQFLSLRKKER